jgi:FKBP-type peptidyl-prolyl cis-trans isomerase
MTVRTAGAAALLVALILSSCKKKPEEPRAELASTPPTTNTKPVSEGPKEITTPRGVRYTDLVPGTGAEARVGSTITVHATGTLENGIKFWGSRDTNTPLTAVLARPGLIEGWVEGVPGMKVGGKRRLVIPSELGYGAAGRPDEGIPPHAKLIFEIEMLKVAN